MIHDMGKRDDEIRALKGALRQSRTQAVKAEIAFLQTHAVNLEKELLLTKRDLEAKRRQLEDLGMVEEEGIVEDVSFSDDYDEGGLTDSVADGMTAALHISPHAHDEDLFGDALESHYDHSHDEYVKDGDEDGDDLDRALDGSYPSTPASSRGQSVYNDDTIVDQAMMSNSPLNHKVVEAAAPTKQYDELRVLYQVQDSYEPNAMFCITKSQNTNCVVYKANISSTSGAINPSEPCSAFWIMFSQRPSPSGRYPTEDLNMIERNTAYGITCMADELGRPDCFSCSIASLSDRKFTVRRTQKSNGRFLAQCVVNGNPNVALRQIHVQMADSWIPKVQHVDIFGLDLDTGLLVHERKIA
ncbi:hypothetical protein TrRE_jg2029 [Triparma retinervis]|uniref:DUF4833 domain-containing protein n=1 Tax=Triparma retinervis TaxID=2557542 RepID=A0A9W7EBF7_9STRA|nr:hypothetical protein TrRE_jg2029 [Triparma retinervis]